MGNDHKYGISSTFPKGLVLNIEDMFLLISLHTNSLTHVAAAADADLCKNWRESS